MSKQIKSIQVFGSGCATCKKLYEATKKAAEELKISVTVEYITDVTKMIEMGVMTSPVLAINGKPVLTGGGNGEAEIKKALEKNLKSDSKPGGGCCSCDNC
ncbi:MAG: thioredoxin family protein [Patescibacteria group bacterium]|jgi:small redox-active disulfide protein 2